MKATNIAAQHANDLLGDVAGHESAFGNDRDIRALQDLELMLVGGGSDGVPVFGSGTGG